MSKEKHGMSTLKEELKNPVGHNSWSRKEKNVLHYTGLETSSGRKDNIKTYN